nr:defensin 6 [Zingiber officinale]
MEVKKAFICSFFLVLLLLASGKYTTDSNLELLKHTCFMVSKTFHGICVKNSKCNDACQSEGWTLGKCVPLLLCLCFKRC